jgi:hypothetical protein
MIKLWVIYDGDKIVAWSTTKMSEDEVEVELTEAEYDKLINT